MSSSLPTLFTTRARQPSSVISPTHVSETDYNTAVTAITGAENVAKVLNAYNTMLSAQTSKQHPYLTKTEAKAATYTETGNHEYYTCSVCQKVFKDAAGT